MDKQQVGAVEEMLSPPSGPGSATDLLEIWSAAHGKDSQKCASIRKGVGVWTDRRLIQGFRDRTRPFSSQDASGWRVSSWTCSATLCCISE